MLFVNSAGSVNANNNWWASNAGPGATGTQRASGVGAPGAGVFTANRWLQLKTTASPSTIVTNQSSSLTASFLSNNLGDAISNANLTTLIGQTVTWSGIGGSVTGQQTTVQAAGTATATYNEGIGVAGAHSATAVVDSGPASGSTNTVAFTVNKANATTVINSDSPDPSVTGQGVAVAYSVTGASGNSPTVPTGNVQVSDGVNSNTGTVAAGSASVGLLTAGNRTLTATYQGDANFNASPASAGAAHLVNKADTTASIISDNPDPSVVGQQITVTYSVAVNAPGTGTPTGNVLVSDGVNSASGTVAAGSVNLTLNTVGNRTLTATYLGDTNYNASPASAGAGHVVNKANTTATITSDTPDPSNPGQAVTVNYTVSVNPPGAGTPTGNVTVSDGVDSAIGTVAGGSAIVTLNTPGNRTLTATYAGDASFNASPASAGAAHFVNSQPPGITSANNTTFTVGTNGSFTVTTTGNPTGASMSITESGALPSGVTFVNNNNGTATLAGTPGAGTGGTYPITITANNGVAPNATQSFTLTVNQAPAITSANSTTFTVGTNGSFQLTASGFPTTYTFSNTGNALPSGVTLSSSGLLSGTPGAGTGGTYNLTFQVSNGVNPAGTQSFTLTVNGPSITQVNPNTGAQGASNLPVTITGQFTHFSASSVVTFGGTLVTAGAPTAATATSLTVPVTIGGSATTGARNVTVTTGGEVVTLTNGFTVTTASNQPPAFTSANNTTFVVGSNGSFTVMTTGSPTPSITIGGDPLPAAVTFADNGNGTGTLSGIPASGKGGVYNLTFTANNGFVAPGATRGGKRPSGGGVTQNFTLTVNEAPMFTSLNNTTFTVGNNGSFQLTAKGYPAPNFSETGALPGGVSFTTAGLLSGIPAIGSEGTYPLSLSAANGIGSNDNQSFSLQVNPAVCVAPPANMIAWYPGDGNFFDIQGPTFENGAAADGAVGFGPGKVQKAFNFSGAGYVTMGTPAVLNLTGTAVTIDGWINPSVTTNDIVYFGKTAYGNNDYALIFQFNQLTGMIKTGSGETIVAASTTPFVPPLNQWTHIALTYDGQMMKLYANGALIGSMAKTGNLSGDASEFAIGGRAVDPFNRRFRFTGSVDEVEVFSRALSDAEIAGIYNASIAGKCRSCTPPPANLNAWLPGNGNTNDVTGNGNNGTLQGNATYAAGYVSQAFTFDGSNDYVLQADSASLRPQFLTVDAWVYPRTVGDFNDAYGPVIFTKDLGNASGALASYVLFGPGNTGKFTAALNFTDASTATISSTDSFAFNQWYHVAMTWDGTILQLWVDGRVQGSLTPANGPKTILYSADNAAIGRHSHVDRSFDGLIDEVEVFGRALSADEIQAIVAAGTAGKCPPVQTNVTVCHKRGSATQVTLTFPPNSSELQRHLDHGDPIGACPP